MVIIVVNIILVICCYLGANYKDWIGQTKEEHYVYEFVDYIRDTLLEKLNELLESKNEIELKNHIKKRG